MMRSARARHPQLAYDPSGNLLLVWFREGRYLMAKNMDMTAITTVVNHVNSSGAADFELCVAKTIRYFLLGRTYHKVSRIFFQRFTIRPCSCGASQLHLTGDLPLERDLDVVQATDGSLILI